LERRHLPNWKTGSSDHYLYNYGNGVFEQGR
jgi:hypothetical protein